MKVMLPRNVGRIVPEYKVLPIHTIEDLAGGGKDLGSHGRLN
jgi:hypothetical protein